MTKQEQELQALEDWLDRGETLPEDRVLRSFAEQLAEARGAYRSLRYRGPMPVPARRRPARRPLALAWAGTAAILLIAAVLWLARPGSPTAPAPGAWNTDTPSARLRALGEGLSAGLAKPERPDGFEFRVPARPSRPGGFGPEAGDSPREPIPGAEGQG